MAPGENADCHRPVSVTVVFSEVPVMLSSRLFLPESWTSDATRTDSAGVSTPFH